MESGRSSASSDSTDVQPKMEQGSPLLMNGTLEGSPYGENDLGNEPYLEIIEQPQARGFRFRYECEGPSHGGLQGERSMRNRKTFPVIKIHNYSGNARIVVTLVTDEQVPRPHAHKLVGKHCNNGVCIVQLKPGQREIQFPNLCVQHITRKKAADVLAQRIMDAMLLDRKIHSGDFNNAPELTIEDMKQAKAEAEMQAKTMQLNVVRLCFQAYLQDHQGQITSVLPSQISNPIYDSKAPGANALKICRMDKYGGCCSGGEEVFLLCEKVQKDDIQVRFVEQNDRGDVIWESFGVFGPHDVHRQYAIVFKTPPYRDTNIEKPVNVLIMLQRKTDTEASDPKSFTFYPQPHDKEGINRKKRKVLPNYPHGGSGFHPADIFGNKDDSSSSSGSNGQFMNRPHGNGAIPDFNNLRMMPTDRNQRTVQQGTRQNQYLSSTYVNNSMAGMDSLFNAQLPQVKQEILDYNPQFSATGNQFQNNGHMNILPGLNHPIKTNPDSPPQNVTTSSNLSTHMVPESCMMSSPQQVMMNSPGYVNAGHSPQHQTAYGQEMTSPHQNMVSPNSMSTGSPQMLNSGADVLQVTQAAYQPSGQSAAVSQSSFPVTESDRIQSMLTQPVQEASSLEMDADLVNTILQELKQSSLQEMKQQSTTFVQEVNPINFDFGNNLAAQSTEFGGCGNPYTNIFNTPQYSSLQNRGSSACGLQSRNATGGLLERFDDNDFDFVDGPGPAGKADYDEVDSARIDRLPYEDVYPTISPVSGKMDNSKVHSEHNYGKTVIVVPCSDSQLEQKVDEENVSSKAIPEKGKKDPETLRKTVIQSSNLTVSSNDGGSDVTEATKQGSETRQAGITQPAGKTYSAGLGDVQWILRTMKQTSEALQHYAATGDIRYLLMVQRYLMLVQDINGDMPLHTALINEKYEVFQNLLDVMLTLPDAKRRINAYNYNYQTPLHLAVLTDQPGAMILLIRAGADPTLPDRNGRTPAHLAVKYGKNDCLAALLHYLRKGCSVEEPFPELNLRCYDGFTPAHLAAQTENLVAMKLLVHGKADINLPDGKSGKTPLHHVVEVDELSIAAYLILQAGANVNMKRFDGNSPLHVACGRESIGMVALLMAGGADPKTENDDIDYDIDYDDPSYESDSSDINTETRGTEVTARSEVIPGSEVNGDIANEEGSGSSTGSDSEDEVRVETTHRGHGLTPSDFVANNEKILRILNGEPYINIIENGGEDRDMERTTSILSSLRLTSKESGIGSMGFHSGGDMEKLTYRTRVTLSKLLDPCRTGCDWQTLADKLGLRTMMEGHIGDHSPTRLLLTYFEACGGTISSLTTALSDMKREDAIDILTHTEEPDSNSNVVKEPLKDQTHDSGLESLRQSKSPVVT